MSDIKKRLHSILESSDLSDRWSRSINLFMTVLIAANVLAVILETVASIREQYGAALDRFEILSVIVFSIEYLARLWTCNEDGRYSGWLTGRVRFAATPMLIVDIMAILPFYLPLLLPYDMRFVRVLRLLRLSRLLKLGRYSEAMQTLGRVLKSKREELSVSVFAVVVLLILASSVMYHVEHSVQPVAFSSIPATMWWGVATLTTVGYGDVYPITALGKILGAIIAILGIGLFALPAGILASGFSEAFERKNASVCPHCGKTTNKNMRNSRGDSNDCDSKEGCR